VITKLNYAYPGSKIRLKANDYFTYDLYPKFREVFTPGAIHTVLCTDMFGYPSIEVDSVELLLVDSEYELF
jgi:hypothetical protein